ncbi:hypothetical protein [Pseudoalteromonas luteoviolacea]|uniref:Lipoprotein n=1 Tax=Pseudoalteromonas luteoviolacea S4054 TaxID=1129367 RepID=A0A0F6ADL9_9GAMM|nr:hypothetical protein [Pseudoalteromonas luteoviolacea]AOT08520.1 hypothetical protein S4054249_11970 [Pseudoalteromonas luteoviolacea]AOT13436.1 hypothetical protein S40542_11945 [Pseudoalteromonas luteoviolacea]AOT18349.1 hypothetical protein S4054_11945 [Pseudoalteromonas luteoviolacea]KKE83484.1 hypothetical protein N479_14020 [Pseudoalteromonas luteoviolacea S4054]KZN75921.1 hypothetical protein N481_06115 [Pseudoalteromonas luteoviolacea S4047-1]
MKKTYSTIKSIILFTSLTSLQGCYFFSENIVIDKCFSPFSISEQALSKNIETRILPPSDNLISNGYSFTLIDKSYNYGQNRKSEGDINFTGDLILKVPNWAHKYIGGNPKGLYFEIKNSGQKGITSFLTMKNHMPSFLVKVKPHCKNELLKTCPNNKCSYKDVLN